jgi:dUTP pyrophosphatase
MLKNIGLTTNISVLPNENIQPNAVDLNIDRVWEIGTDEFYIGIDKKQHRKDTKEIFPDSTGEWLLEAGKKYQFDTSHWVAIPEGFAGWLIPRSTLNRNGISITSGLYDSGFQNYVGAVMHIGCGNARIQKGARVAQFVYCEAETGSMYDGDYNAKDTRPH